MNKEKQDLLNNPLVKQIASDFARTAMQKFTVADEFGSWKGNDAEWDDFILSHVKTQQPVKEWEVMAYKSANGNMLYNNRGELRLDIPNSPLFSQEAANQCSIHSVKRLSDGEVFTVGDETTLGPINKFVIEQGALLARSEKDSYEDIAYLKKAKQPLFTPEDGKDALDGDEIYWINAIEFEILTPFKLTPFAAHNHKKDDCYKYFSTKEAAEEWVRKHKLSPTAKEFAEAAESWSKNMAEHILMMDKMRKDFLEQFKKTK